MARNGVVLQRVHRQVLAVTRLLQAAMRNADQNLARILRALEIMGVRDSTDVIVVSDHGASTVATLQDLAEALTKAGIPARRQFTEKPAPGEQSLRRVSEDQQSLADLSLYDGARPGDGE